MKMKLVPNWGIVSGDICGVPCDAVVNAANPTLMGGGGVDGAIHDAAGNELAGFIAERVKVIRTQDDDPDYPIRCETGGVVATPSFGMTNCKAILHTVGPIWHGGGRGEPEQLARCYWNCLEKAKELGLHSVAFPCISAGCYGYPPNMAADVAVKTVARWRNSWRGGKLCDMKVMFVVMNEQCREAYENFIDYYMANRELDESEVKASSKKI